MCSQEPADRIENFPALPPTRLGPVARPEKLGRFRNKRSRRIPFVDPAKLGQIFVAKRNDLAFVHGSLTA